MKKIFCCMALLCLCYGAFAQKEIPVESKIGSVTVYLQGAEINRSASAQLAAGATDVVFTGLTANIDEKTIQMNGAGDFTILGVVYRLSYLKTQQKQQKQKLLEDSLELLNADLSENLNSQSALNGMADMLDANKTVSGSNTSLSLELLKSTLDYYQTKMQQVKNDLSGLKVKEKKMRDHTTQMQNELNALNQKNNQPTGEIVVQVTAKQPVQANFDISYIENNAGWSPEYDIRAANVNSPVELTYKANVYQNTGDNWDNVKLKLSSGNPTVSLNGPTLTPWYLYLGERYFLSDKKFNAAPEANTLTTNSLVTPMTDTVTNINERKNAASSYQWTTVVQNQVAFEFNINIPYTIPSDGKNHVVQVQDYTMPGLYEYYCIPKLSTDAFLTVGLTDWGKMNLMSGNANIFFESAYVGQSYIDANNTKDTLTLSLGMDKKIIVKREQVQDFTRTQSIGNKIKKTYTYDISVKNTKDIPIIIRIEDALPISQDKDIDVQLIDGASGVLDANTGRIKWICNLQPNGAQKIHWSFSVQYPKDKTISGL